MSNDNTFGEIIKRLRDARGLTLREVAEKLGIDTSMLGKIEKNNRRPTKVLIQKFADFFQVKEEELTIAFLSDNVAYQVMSESELARKVLKVAEKKVEYLKNKNSKK